MTNTSSPNPSDPPDFHRLNEYLFQDLTCALIAVESHIATADLFGERGQKQYGVDVIGHRKDVGIDVASCKRCAKVTPSLIVNWSNEFLNHWEKYWKLKGIKRFVLAVTAPIHFTQVAEKVLVERNRFLVYGLDYEVWGPRQLQERIRPHRGIALQFLNPEHANRICGTSIDNRATVSTVIPQLVVSQLASLQTELSTEVEGSLDLVMDRIRRGDLQQVSEQLKSRRNGTHWNQLRPATQARLIRLQGSLRLQHGDDVGAEHFADEADAITLPDEPRLRALLAARKIGAEAGLSILDEPSSRDGVQLKLSLLIESGRRDEAFNLLDTHPILRESNAETERLRAFVELLRGQRTKSLQAIQRSEHIEPQWPTIRRAGAIIRYAMALSPTVTADWCLTLKPVDLDLVREDDEARAHLAEALSRFEALAAEDVDPAMRDNDQIWALACLSNLRHRLQEAEKRCQVMLADVPTHTMAIIWALARGFEFDRARSIRELESLATRHEADAQHVLALAWLLDDTGKTEAAVQVMRESSEVFVHPLSRAVHEQWIIDHSPHTNEQNPLGESGWSVAHRLTTLVQRARVSGDWSHVEILFRNLTASANVSPLALPAARALAAADRWPVLAAHAETLLLFNTAEALRLVVHAYAQTKQPHQVLALLKQAPAAFPNGVLPHDLRVLKIQALATTDPAAALQAAATLTADSTSVADHLLKAKLHLKIGDIRASLPTIRQVAATGTISVETAIGLIPVVSAEDTDLGRELWRYAAWTGIPRDLAAEAFIHAVSLGIQDEAHTVFQDIHQAAQEGRGSIRIVSVEELVDVLHREHKNSIEQQHRYFDGLAPVHAFAAGAGFKVAKIYHLPASDKLDAISGPFMIRHGARPINLPNLTDINRWALHVDITGLLLAAQLGLLDAIERLPQPIAISPVLPELLLELEHHTRPHQPQQIIGCRAILEAVAQGIIDSTDVPTVPGGDTNEAEHTNMALRVAASLQDDTIVVAFRRPTDWHGTGGRVTTLRAVVDGLYRAGALDARAHTDALGQLGIYAADILDPPPAEGSRLLFLADTLSVLATAGLLHPAAKTFRVQVDATYLKQAHAEVVQANHDSGIADYIGVLRRRVAAGIENRRYRYFASTTTANPTIRVNDTDEEPDVGQNPMHSRVMRCLLDMLNIAHTPGAVLWVDDRHVSGYPQHQGNPILGVTDILRSLRAVGCLEEHAYFEALLRLRAAGAMFIPIEYEEVLYHLHAAAVVNRTVQETPALATLRRYLARALLCDRHLKIMGTPTGLDGRPDEMDFLVGLRRLAENCIVRMWKDRDNADSNHAARASWIWDALRVEWMLVGRDNLALDQAERAVLTPALDIVGLLVGAIEILGENCAATIRRRQAFFQWMEENVIGERLEVDVAFADKVIELLRSMLMQHFDPKEFERPQYWVLFQQELSRLLLEYPNVIRQRLLADTDFCRRLNILRQSTVHTLGMEFEARRFWKSIAKARRYGRAHVRALGKKCRIILRSVPKRPDAVRLSGLRPPAILDKPEFGLFERSVEARTTLLHAHLDWFDLPAERCAETIHRISVISDPVERIEHLDAARRRSAALHYSKLMALMKHDTTHQMSLFRPPPAGTLLDHLRLPTAGNQSFTVRLEVGASEFLGEAGPAAAFRRMAALPVPTPDAIVHTINDMAEAEQVLAVKRLCDEARTPLQFIHALHLCRTLANGTPYGDLFQQTLGRMIESWPQAAPLFRAILTWSEIAFEHDPSWSVLPTTDRLAVVWLHADRITEIILTAGFDPLLVTKVFSENHIPRPLRETLRLARPYHTSAAAPDTMVPEILLFHGLAYILNNARATDVIPAEKINALVALLSSNADETHVPSVWLLTNRNSASNELGSFLTIQPFGLNQIDASSATVTAKMDKLLASIETNPLDHDTWINVWGLARPALDYTTTTRFATILESVDLVLLVGTNRDDVFIAHMVMDCWVRYGHEELRPRMLDQFRRLVANLAPTNTERIPTEIKIHSGIDIDRALEQLLETGFVWAQSDDIGIAFSRVGEVMIELTRAWPGSHRILRKILRNILKGESTQHTIHLWRAWNIIRAN